MAAFQRIAIVGLLAAAVGCAGRQRTTSGPPPDASGPHGGRFVAPGGGTALVFCGSPGLSVILKLDSSSAGVTTFAMGMGAIAAGGSNVGTHSADDEAAYFLRGEGRAFVGSDTMEVRPGLVMFVPRGVRHGFISTGSTPLEFLWTIAPGQLATGFRARGVTPGTPCPPQPG
jgi:mannose-6-phosphate isomerase-like protein (cupin superfamily)